MVLSGLTALLNTQVVVVIVIVGLEAQYVLNIAAQKRNVPYKAHTHTHTHTHMHALIHNGRCKQTTIIVHVRCE